MTTRCFVTVLFLVSFFTANAQIEKCNLTRSIFSRLYTVNVEDVICLAQNSDKDITIFFTYADWCAPCRRKLPGAIKLAEKHNVDFYVLLVDRESDRFSIGRALQTLDSLHNIKAVIITDSLYSEGYLERLERRDRRPIRISGRTARDKYRNFLTLITPPEFENIPGMGKFIVLNNKGEVILVTNYRDAGGARSAVEGDARIFNRVVQVIENSRRE